MKYDPKIHHRRSIRLPNYDYTREGAYFITVCTCNRECLFGRIVDHIMGINEVGRIVGDEWVKTGLIRDGIELGEWVVMPNHFHALLIISDVGAYGIRPKNIPNGLNMNLGCLEPKQICSETNHRNVGSIEPVTLGDHRSMNEGVCHTPLRSPSHTVGAIVRGFKTACTKHINALEHSPGRKLWQRNYWEHIIRSQREMDGFRECILTNPQRWCLDPLNQEML